MLLWSCRHDKGMRAQNTADQGTVINTSADHVEAECHTCPKAGCAWGSGHRAHCKRRAAPTRPPASTAHLGKGQQQCTALEDPAASPPLLTPSVRETAYENVDSSGYFAAQVPGELIYCHRVLTQTSQGNCTSQSKQWPHMFTVG